MINLKFYLKSALLATAFGAFTFVPQAMEKDEEENNSENKESSLSVPVQKEEENLQDKSFDSWFLRNNGANLSSSSSLNFGNNQTSYHYVDSTDRHLSSSNSFVSKNYTRDLDSVVRIDGSPPSPPPFLSSLLSNVDWMFTSSFFDLAAYLKENNHQSPDEAMFWKIIPITIDYLKQPISTNFIGIEGLPKEMMIHILSFFTAPELIQFSRVSKAYKKVIDFDPSLQKILFNYFFEQKKSTEPEMIETRAFMHFISARYGFYGKDVVKEISKDVKHLFRFLFPKSSKRLLKFEIPESKFEIPEFNLELFKAHEYHLDLASMIIPITSENQTEKMDEQGENIASTDQIENDDRAEKTDDNNLND